MKKILFAVVLIALTGCVSTRKAKLQAQEAYIQGQQQAVREAQQAKNPTVTVQGNVKTPSIPWTDGLTLSQAIVAANYQGITSPRTIRIVRNQQPIDVKAADLLKGHDVPLQAGDLIIILY